MDLSEEKAKAILMLLAKKAGFDCIAFSGSYDGMSYLGYVKNSKSYFIGWVRFNSSSVTSRAFSHVGMFHELKSSRKSYMHFLEMMLDVAKVYDIKTYGPEGAVVVMRKGTTLEELLIELDLLGTIGHMHV